MKKTNRISIWLLSIFFIVITTDISIAAGGNNVGPTPKLKAKPNRTYTPTEHVSTQHMKNSRVRSVYQKNETDKKKDVKKGKIDKKADKNKKVSGSGSGRSGWKDNSGEIAGAKTAVK